MAIEDEKVRRIIAYLSNQFKMGKVIIFTGSGFSASAKNLQGKTLPSSPELARLMWTAFFPGQPFSSFTLKDVYGAVKKYHKSKIKPFLEDIFTVDSQTLPDFYLNYYALPWFEWFTLNIDNLEEAANIKFNLPLKYQGISGTNATSSDYHNNLTVFSIIHLNGKLTDLPDHVTFTDHDFIDRLIFDDPIYSQISSKLISFPVIFIGTELDEPLLWKYIEMRKYEKLKYSGVRTIMPKSFLVSPTISKAKEMILDDYNVEHIECSTETFSLSFLANLERTIYSNFIDIRKRSLNLSSGMKYESIPDVSNFIKSEKMIHTEYLLGSEPKWCDILSGRAIERDVDIELFNNIVAKINQNILGDFILLTGTAGSGKSTTLMRVALKLSAMGYKTGWIDKGVNISPKTIQEEINTCADDDRMKVVLIDDADMYGDSLSLVIYYIAKAQSDTLIVLSMRSNRIDRCLNAENQKSHITYQLSMPGMTDADIYNILDALEKENRLGALKNLERSEQFAIFKSKSKRQLIVAMYEATSGRKFEEKIVEEFTDLPDRDKQIYGIVAIASSLRSFLVRDEILGAINNVSNDALNSLEKMVDRKIIIKSDNEQYTARHRVIAEKIHDHLVSNQIIQYYLEGIIFTLAARVRPNMDSSDRIKRLLISMINYNYLFYCIGLEKTRQIYQNIESLLKDDYHYWLQRASLEIGEGELSNGENFIMQAKAIKPDDDYVLTEYALLLFKKACSNPGAKTSKELVKDASDILKYQMKYRRTKAEHPFHIFGSQMITWTKNDNLIYQEKKELLEEAQEYVQTGLGNCPRSEKLDRLLRDIKSNYMALAIDAQIKRARGQS